MPAPIRSKVERNLKPYVVAYHYKLNPEDVLMWDNEAVLKAFYALEKMGVIK